MLAIEKLHSDKTLKVTNWILAGIIVLVNIYFLPLSLNLYTSTGGPMGIGLLLLPATLSINFLLITAFPVFNSKYHTSRGLLFLNGFGVLWSFFWMWLSVTAA
ncbi:MAG: hypothetical protein ACRBF0_09000 [Calditrichia bacterium]